MTTEKNCPTCGKPLPEGALMGLCPDCLLQAGFGTMDTGPAAKKTTPFEPPTPGELSRYFPELEIIELLGRGGMGAVYKARQKRLERLVALKILPPSVGQDPSFADRFEREAKALAQLHHPNIVTLYDSGQSDGLFYFFMEFVDGVNLRQLLDTGHLSPKEALAIVPQICDALQFAHDRGIIHRDIKPENILLNKAGQVKIADFGVAKIVAQELPKPAPGDAVQDSGQTEAGKVIGTPQYMAPEQLSNPLDVDNRADIYALGVVFYQMLTGELPAGKFEPPSRKAQVDVRLDDIVLRALEKNPEQRYQQASVMKTQVETIAGTPGEGKTPPTSTKVPPELPPARSEAPSAPIPRLSRTAVVGAVWVLFFIPAVLFFFIQSEPSYGQPPVHSFIFGTGLLLLLIPFCAPVATTLLGWIAVTQIRHSAGRIYGLGLAVFDGLLFPVLVLDLIIARVISVAVGMIGDSLPQSWLEHTTVQSPNSTHTEPTFLARLLFDHRLDVAQFSAMAVIVVADYLVIRWAWRAVNKWVNDATAAAKPGPSSFPPASQRSGWKTAALILCLAAILAVPLSIMIGHWNLASVSADRGNGTLINRSAVPVSYHVVMLPKLQLAKSEAALQKLKSGTIQASDPQAAKSNVAALEDAVLQFETKWARFEQTIAQYKNGAVTHSDFETAQNEIGTAEARLRVIQAIAENNAGNGKFGPVVECVVPANNESPWPWFDIDTGKVIISMQGDDNDSADFVAVLPPPPQTDLRTWASVQGLSTGDETGFGSVPLEASMWDSLTPDKLLERLKSATADLLNGAQPLPRTYGFTTRAGNIGILQILGTSDTPRGIKIRYKLTATSSTGSDQLTTSTILTRTHRVTQSSLDDARNNLKIAQNRYAAGTTDELEVLLAKQRFEWTEAMFEGNRNAAAVANRDGARKRLAMMQKLYENGVLDRGQLAPVQQELAEAEAALAELGGAPSQDSNGPHSNANEAPSRH